MMKFDILALVILNRKFACFFNNASGIFFRNNLLDSDKTVLRLNEVGRKSKPKFLFYLIVTFLFNFK